MPTYYLRSGTQTWNTNAAWSLTSGGGATGLIPTALDDIILDANSGNVTLATTTGVCKSFNATNYTGTITFTVGLTVSGNITLGASMGISGAGTLTINAAGTIDSKGKIWPNTFTMSGSSLTITLANNDFQVGAFTNNNTTGVLNGSTLTLKVNGAMTMSQALTGTATISLIGTGSWTGSGALGNNLTFNSGGTIGITSVTYAAQSGGSTITYTAGTVNHSGTLQINGPNTTTLNTSGVNWLNISLFSSSFTLNLNQALVVTGTLTFQTSDYTLGGSSGATIGTLTWNTAPVSNNTGIVLTAGNTYTVTTALTLYSLNTVNTPMGIRSSSAGSQANLILNQGATQLVGGIFTKDINSSGGQTIWNWKPSTQNNVTNWNALTSANMQFSSTFAS